MSKQEPQTRPNFWQSRTGIVFLCFVSVAVFLLAYEHRAHIFTGNTFLFVLLGLCVGMHFFMHGSHSGQSGHQVLADEPKHREPKDTISLNQDSRNFGGERK